MPRVVREAGTYYLFYEGADTDFTCERTNRYGWGVARSADLTPCATQNANNGTICRRRNLRMKRNRFRSV